jgi:hypothetical protein
LKLAFEQERQPVEEIQRLQKELEQAQVALEKAEREYNYEEMARLRGADLRYEDLHALPLTRLRGSLTRAEWDEATEEQRAAAAVLLLDWQPWKQCRVC